MILQSSDINDYLRATPVIDWDHPLVREKAKSVIGESGDNVANAKALFEWVRDQIPHAKDIGAKVVTCKASEVLDKGTGLCYAKSHLLAALCRSVGIPAGLCYQVFARLEPYGGTGVHGFNALFLSSIGKWIRVDARGNTGDINAQFDLDHEKLAFPVDPAQGELFVYETVFTDPVPQVVDVLTRCDKLDEVLLHLPPLVDDDLLPEQDRALNSQLALYHGESRWRGGAGS